MYTNRISKIWMTQRKDILFFYDVDIEIIFFCPEIPVKTELY